MSPFMIIVIGAVLTVLDQTVVLAWFPFAALSVLIVILAVLQYVRPRLRVMGRAVCAIAVAELGVIVWTWSSELASSVVGQMLRTGIFSSITFGIALSMFALVAIAGGPFITLLGALSSIRQFQVAGESHNEKSVRIG